LIENCIMCVRARVCLRALSANSSREIPSLN